MYGILTLNMQSNYYRICRVHIISRPHTNGRGYPTMMHLSVVCL